MPKIHKLEIYGLDPDISLEDYLVGTNGDLGRNKKTQSFKLGSIAALISNYIGNVGIDQDNIGKVKTFALIGEPTIANIVSLINDLPSYTIDQKQDQWFQGIVFIPSVEGVETTRSEIAYMVNIRLVNVGKGTYGVGGTALSSSNLHVVSISYPSIVNIQSIPSTVTISYGGTDSNVQTFVNASDPPIVIQSQENGYVVFTGNIEGTPTDYLFVGVGGTYGVGGLTAVASDFQIIATAPVSGALPDLHNVLGVGNITNRIARFWNGTLDFLNTISNSGMNIINPTNTTQIAAGFINLTTIIGNKIGSYGTESFAFAQSGIQKTLRFGSSLLAENSIYQFPNKPYNTGLPYTLACIEDDLRPYKTLVGLISQSGTNVPTIVVLENTTGSTFTTSRYGAGRFAINFATGILSGTKTYYSITQDNNNQHIFFINYSSALGNVSTVTIDAGRTLDALEYIDGSLQSTPFEIRVYN